MYKLIITTTYGTTVGCRLDVTVMNFSSKLIADAAANVLSRSDAQYGVERSCVVVRAD